MQQPITKMVEAAVAIKERMQHCLLAFFCRFFSPLLLSSTLVWCWLLCLLEGIDEKMGTLARVRLSLRARVDAATVVDRLIVARITEKKNQNSKKSVASKSWKICRLPITVCPSALLVVVVIVLVLRAFLFLFISNFGQTMRKDGENWSQTREIFRRANWKDLSTLTCCWKRPKKYHTNIRE